MPRGPSACPVLCVAIVCYGALAAAQDAHPRHHARHRRRHPTATETPVAPPTPPVAYAPFPVQPAEGAQWAIVPAPLPPPPAEEAPPRHRPAALDVNVGIQVFWRSMTWNGNSTQSFHNYSLGPAEALSAAVEWYPGAHFSSGVPSWFGLVASFDHDLGIVSVNTLQQQFASTAWGAMAGLRFRYPFGRSDLGLTLGYGLRSFTINNSAAPPDPGEPSVAYHYVDVAVGGRIAVTERVSILAKVEVMPVLSGGDLTSTYFPHASVIGAGGTLGVAVGIVAGLEARASFDARWFLTTTNATASDMWFVTGASDRYLTGTFSLAWRH